MHDKNSTHIALVTFNQKRSHYRFIWGVIMVFIIYFCIKFGVHAQHLLILDIDQIRVW